VLLMRRRRDPNRGLLSPPGGKLEPGEDPLTGGEREMREETGLDPVRIEPRGVAHHRDESGPEEWLQHFFVVTAFRGTLRRAHPEGDLDWYGIDDLLGGRLPVPPADPVYQRAVLDRTTPPCRFSILHAGDGSVLSVRAR